MHKKSINLIATQARKFHVEELAAAPKKFAHYYEVDDGTRTPCDFLNEARLLHVHEEKIKRPNLRFLVD